MPTPLIDDVPALGYEVSIVPLQEPRAAQAQPYFGRDGAGGRLDGGRRGTTLTVSGELRGASPELLGIAFSALRQYDDGAAHVLTDTYGIHWRQCLLTSVGQSGKVRRPPGCPYYSQHYTCELLCLTG